MYIYIYIKIVIYKDRFFSEFTGKARPFQCGLGQLHRVQSARAWHLCDGLASRCSVPGSRRAWKELNFGATGDAAGSSEQELHDELQLLRQKHGKKWQAAKPCQNLSKACKAHWNVPPKGVGNRNWMCPRLKHPLDSKFPSVSAAVMLLRMEENRGCTPGTSRSKGHYPRSLAVNDDQ